MAAALLRLLPRRRPATLAPLIPASTSSYSKPPYPLRAVTAARVLPDARRRAQLCASPVPSMLGLYAIEVSAAATSVLPGTRRMQLSLLLVPTPTCHFSSTGWFSDKVVNDLREQSKMIGEAIETLEKAVCLLEEGLDDEAFSMFDKGSDDLLKALAIFEKRLDDLVKVIGSCDELTLATQNIKITRAKPEQIVCQFQGRDCTEERCQGVSTSDGIPGTRGCLALELTLMHLFATCLLLLLVIL